jgi:hypothetical protein
MRIICAALLGAAATLPSLTHATPAPANPADATASVPALVVPSAFDGYHPYRDSERSSWRQSNQAVLDDEMPHGMPPARAADGGSDHPMHKEATE